MPTFLKNFLRKRIALVFFATLFVVVAGIFSISSPAQAVTCASLGGTCSTSLCVSPSVSLNGTCGVEEVCCGPTSTGGGSRLDCVQMGRQCKSSCNTVAGEVDVSRSLFCSTGVCCESRSLGGGGTDGGPGGGGVPVPRGGGVPAPTAPTSITFTNPLQYDTVEGVLDSILDTLRNIIVILSLVFIVIGAILYITSAGNDKQMTMAKGAVTAAMIGLAIGLAAPSFLKEIGTVLGWDASVNQDALEGAQTLSQIARNVLDFLLSIVGVLAIIMLVVGGIMYLTAAGSEDQLDTAKKIVWYSIIGIVTALAALVIVSQIATFFG